MVESDCQYDLSNVVFAYNGFNEPVAVWITK
jgi:hypothetical protein